MGGGHILRHMRRLNNWTCRNVTDFLKSNGFSFFEELPGSHERWVKRGADGTIEHRVEVNFTHGEYPVKTLKTIIRQSSIHQDHWIKWAGS